MLTILLRPRRGILEARAPVKLGADPGKNPKRKEYFGKYCGKPVTIPKPSSSSKAATTAKPTSTSKAASTTTGKTQTTTKPKTGKRSTSEGNLVARAAPAGFDEVAMGENKARKAGQNGLWSTGFGTCVGFAVTGTPNPAGGNTRFLLHMTTADWPSMLTQWDDFAAKVDAARLTGMSGIMYTVDTRTSNTQELTDDFMKGLAKDMETDYAAFWTAFRGMVPGAARAYHPFSRTGTLQINQQNRINYT